MLEASGLEAGYLGENVVEGVDLRVAAGEAVAVIGSNGAGKTTLFRAICGMLPVSAGRVRFDGRDITGRPDPSVFELVFDLFPRLKERPKQPAGSLSGGEQQMLAVGRALMSRPRLLMLDEPTTGLAPKLARSAYQALQALKETGVTLLVAEQQVPLALSLADRGYVLENGRVRLEGASEDLERNPEVRRAYLGVA